ncbi:Protein-ribulosamine 3-kinase, chloroplastic [Dichanthelium oligosanthes]|uniref:protein-ribulosamine 3-kinase n=1 Tax=Dichanthelium oligosanthes TaxID=888268 RepID=A0A1E5WJG1_9POAL|nr:Protein-ribulosamine 3-kinase, chloroplastic [Dichanthelium oligosanthes]
MAANVALLSASSPSTSAASSFLSRRPLSRCCAAFPRRASSRLSIMAALGDDPIREWILTEGKATQIKGTRSIGGGCINSAQRYDTDAGPFFVKTNSRIGPEMFEGEALGLKAMYDTKSIRVPLPYKVRELTKTNLQSALGRKLAEMHKAAKSDNGYGFHVDNTIGSTPQINTWTADWIEFYSKHRLGYQLELASRRYGDSAIYEKGQRLIKNIRPLFDGAVLEPCLLHGDLWSGNISSDTNGDPVILDPACYYGHNEAEFGMSWCAGFGGDFYNAYFQALWSVDYSILHYFDGDLNGTLLWYIQVMPKQPGFEKRRDLYLLYHYLNHYNLFGSGYRSSAMSIIEDYLYLLAV